MDFASANQVQLCPASPDAAGALGVRSALPSPSFSLRMGGELSHPVLHYKLAGTRSIQVQVCYNRHTFRSLLQSATLVPARSLTQLLLTPTRIMDLGDGLQAAEVGLSILSLLVTSLGAYLTWHAANGMPLQHHSIRGAR